MDKNKWHTCRGVISVTGQKFMNWTLATGGGGAIDLVIHLEQYDFKTAVLWLLDNFSCSFSCLLSPPPDTQDTSRPGFRLPRKNANRLPQMIGYLRYQRCIPIGLINALIGSSKLYADDRGNAVFLLLGKKKGGGG